jgi:plastocyanin
MRLLSRQNATAIVAVSIVFVSLGIAACVSERATTTTTATTGTCTAPTNTAGATIIFIRDFVFVPAIIHVKAGGSVAWVNCEPTAVPHTSSADAGAWNSPGLAPNDAFTRAFPTAGSFPYHCAIHPSMKATVIVD